MRKPRTESPFIRCPRPQIQPSKAAERGPTPCQRSRKRALSVKNSFTNTPLMAPWLRINEFCSYQTRLHLLEASPLRASNPLWRGEADRNRDAATRPSAPRLGKTGCEGIRTERRGRRACAPAPPSGLSSRCLRPGPRRCWRSPSGTTRSCPSGSGRTCPRPRRPHPRRSRRSAWTSRWIRSSRGR